MLGAGLANRRIGPEQVGTIDFDPSPVLPKTLTIRLFLRILTPHAFALLFLVRLYVPLPMVGKRPGADRARVEVKRKVR